MRNVTAAVPAGRVTGLFGPNGSGKYTLIRAIAGVQSGVEGKLSVLNAQPGNASVRHELGYMTQAPSVYEDLTITENLGHFAALRGADLDGLLARVQLERLLTTLERLLTTPLGRLELVGYSLSFGTIATAQAVVACALTLGPLGLHVRGPSMLVVALAVCVPLLGMGLGLLASAFARTEYQVVQFLPPIVVPQLLLCGLLLARERMPRALHLISDVLPMSYAVDGMHHLTRQVGASAALWADIAIVLGFAGEALVLGAAAVRRRTA